MATEDADFETRVVETVAYLRDWGELVTPDLRVNSSGAACLLGVKQTTLRNWRHQGIGPRFFEAGQVWYRVRDILQWVSDREQEQQQVH